MGKNLSIEEVNDQILNDVSIVFQSQVDKLGADIEETKHQMQNYWIPEIGKIGNELRLAHEEKEAIEQFFLSFYKLSDKRKVEFCDSKL